MIKTQIEPNVFIVNGRVNLMTPFHEALDIPIGTKLCGVSCAKIMAIKPFEGKFTYQKYAK